jgi:hypothetical protein
MPQPQKLEKAQLIPLVNGTTPGDPVEVQFNPQSLKLNYSNQIPGGTQPQGSSPQFASTGVTKLTMELWFDVTLPPQSGSPAPGGDVRKLTEKLVSFMNVQNTNSTNQQIRTPPNLKFSWGSFVFTGTMDSMDETIDLFSPAGVPLRSNVSISLSKHDITFEYGPAAGNGSGGAGTTPLSTAKAGDSLQQMAAQAGISNWQGVAQANGIANPRLLQPGTMVNLSISI